MNSMKFYSFILFLFLSSIVSIIKSQSTESSTELINVEEGELDDNSTFSPIPEEIEDKVTRMLMSIVTTLSPVDNVSMANVDVPTTMTAELEETTTSVPTTSTSTTTTKRPGPLSPCEKLLLKSDQCTKQALFIGDNYENIEIPKDLNSMEKMCNEKTQDVNCIKEYGSKCLKNVPRQIYMSIIKNIRKLFQTYCKTTVGKRAFLGHMECIRTEHLAILNEVLGKLTLTLDYSAEEVPRAEIITYACCSLHRTYSEVPQAMANICAPKVTPADTVKFFQSLIRRSVGDILDVGCGRYASLEYCDANFKTGMKNIRNHLSKAKTLPSESFIVPLIKFSKKIDDSR